MFASTRHHGSPPATYASFERDWVPSHYLADYYRIVEPDELATIRFFVNAMAYAERDQAALIFGVGPTLHHVFLAAGVSSELHLADYLPRNLEEIQRWMRGESDAHDWTPFVRYTLQCEGLQDPGDWAVRQRCAAVRRQTTRLLQADAGESDPLLGAGHDQYSTVISAYCADSATADRDVWRNYMRNITSKVRPGGMFITAALRRSSGYVVGAQTFPSANIDEVDLREILDDDFDWDRGMLSVVELPSHEAQG